MSKRSVVASLALITIGIILGALIVSNFSGGVGSGFADNKGDIRLGGPVPVTNTGVDLKNFNNAFTSVAKAVTPSVVSITVTSSGDKDRGKNMPRDFFHFFGPDFGTPDQQPSQGAGSGVIVTADGYIVTNNHVVDDADKDGIEVALNDKTRYKAKLIGTDPTTDLAVIKIDAKNLSVAALGNSDNVQVGEWVLAIGNPLGLTSTVTAGIISAVGRGNIGVIRTSDNYGIEDFIQTDAAINPGNSGGALVNLTGEVVGINSAIATTNQRYQGYGFAVPVNLLKTVVVDLIKEGKVRRGYIGVQISGIDQTTAKALGLSKAEGVLVQSLVAGGAGEAAGLKERDVILSVDGKEVNAANELQSFVATRHPGDVVTLKVFRDGKTVDKKVTLKARDEEPTTVKASDKVDRDEDVDRDTPKETTFDALGMTVRPITPEEKKKLSVDGGAVVTEVKPYGEAFSRGIGQNLVILEADRKDVKSPSDLKKIVDARKPGDSILMRLKAQDGSTRYVAVQLPKE
jgi:serine protease Do